MGRRRQPVIKSVIGRVIGRIDFSVNLDPDPPVRPSTPPPEPSNPIHIVQTGELPTAAVAKFLISPDGLLGETREVALRASTDTIEYLGERIRHLERTLADVRKRTSALTEMLATEPLASCRFCQGAHRSVFCDRYANLSNRLRKTCVHCRICLTQQTGSHRCEPEDPCRDEDCIPGSHSSALCYQGQLKMANRKAQSELLSTLQKDLAAVQLELNSMRSLQSELLIAGQEMQLGRL